MARKPAYTLVTRTGKDTYIKADGSVGTAGKGGLVSEDVSLTLSTRNEQSIFQHTGGELGEYIVRRLTPMECERLQGFPDDWTRIKWKGKPEEECPDGPRYKAIGNSMAVPVMLWIGERIEMADKGDADGMPVLHEEEPVVDGAVHDG